MIIAVVGGEDAGERDLRDAEEIGRLIAQGGHVLICGGRGGVMAAACRGARSAGGHTIGVLPEADRGGANAWVEFPVVTGMGRARNIIIVLSADAVIAVDGSYGTLSEVAFALQHGRPVVGLNTWGLDLAGVRDDNVLRATSPEDAVRLAIDAAAAGAGPA